MTQPKGERRADPEPAAWLAGEARDRRLGRRHLGDDALAAIVEHASRLGQRQAPRRAVQELDPEIALETRNLLGNLRLGDAEASGGGGKSLRLDHLGEDPHGC